MTVKQAKKYISQNHFSLGSMLPKVEAGIDFVNKTSKKALISSPHSIIEALNGKIGTWITK